MTNELSAEIASIASDNAIATTAETVSESNLEELPVEATLDTSDRTLSVTAAEIPDSNSLNNELAAETLSTNDETFAVTTEEIPDHHLVVSEVSGEITLPVSDRTLSETTDEISDDDLHVSAVSVQETVPTDEISDDDSLVQETLPVSDRTLSETTDEISDDNSLVQETLPVSDRTLSETTEEIPDHNSQVSEVSVQETLPTSDDTLSVTTEEISTSDLVVSESAVGETPAAIPDGSLVIAQFSGEKSEDGIIDQPVSPVWLKGETAEQILQSLIDQALPTLLLEDEQLEEVETIQPLPPLKLTLEQDNYVARWGQGLSINANVELQTQPDLEDEPQYPTTFYALEAKIELRSPLSSEVLAQVRQPLADNVLPFAINSAINIPIDCESKLLLGELSLYGAISDFDDVTLLANSSFTITADVSELLAIATVAKSYQQNLFDNSSTLAVSLPSQEPETSVSLGLELFNLVKTTSTQPQTILSSPSQPLPPQINLLSLKKSGDWRSPQLPKLPENQTSAIAINDQLTEVPSEVDLQDHTPPIPLAPINLEQLEIKSRPGWMAGNVFPYLKRRNTAPTETTDLEDISDPPLIEESLVVEPEIENPETNNAVLETLASPVSEQENLDLDNSVVETLTSTDSSELENLDLDDSLAETLTASNSEPENPDVDDSVVEKFTPASSELFAVSMLEMPVTPSLEFSDDSILEPATPFNSELMAEVNPYSSPLIRKWMQSQGYVVPELPPLPKQRRNTEVLEPVPVDEDFIEPDLPIPNFDVDTELATLDSESETNVEVESSLNFSEVEEITEPDVTIAESEFEENTENSIITAESEELNISADVETENITQEESNSSLPLTELPLNQKIKIPRAWLAQEIVVDDTDSEPIEEYSVEQPQQSIPAVSSFPLDGEKLEPLPIPQLHIPAGELIAGQSVRVRVELPEVPAPVVVKLWIEDCQTRGLLDGPHVLKDLLPKALGGVEVMTQINIPFGCVEIRLEAIAFNPSTQQESHKASAIRTVIPPDLPNYQLDELLGL
ncbi:hypothetical protein [Nostoc piscinale]|uniref:hypothetical protein n=1 Tax=Nostoc piscinale TaxID=224012 RepID=UPI001F2B3774|nr:hypothetical protein [Nostoc piscinale]